MSVSYVTNVTLRYERDTRTVISLLMYDHQISVDHKEYQLEEKRDKILKDALSSIFNKSIHDNKINCDSLV